ncbi:MAG: CoA-binding protein [Chloroflexota bacterium]|nr:CoA-binding protein [Chloroflexota bacterium]
MSPGHPLDDIFMPRSIAVVGVSTNELRESIAGWVPRLLSFGYEGQIYPINPRASEIMGMTAYPSVRAIPHPVDYAIFNIPARSTPEAMADCAARGVKGVHCFTAGFAETGRDEGRALERELTRIAREGGVRVIGPNCMGVYCPRGRLSFYPTFSPEVGNVGMLAQTGAGTIRLVSQANHRGITFSKVISYGNACDLDAPELIGYLAQDADTEVIACYIEGVNDGRAFLQAVRECSRRKPVVVLKAGATESGAQAAASHTASLAGSAQAWRSFFRQSGAIAVEGLEEMVDTLVALRLVRCPRGPRVGIVGRGGGIGVIAADICERVGLTVPAFSAETRERLAAINPEAGASVRNPVETALGLAGASQFYREGLALVDADPGIDLIISHIGLDVYGGWGPSLAEQLGETVGILIEEAQTLEKPVALVLYAGHRPDAIEAVAQAQERCREAGLALFYSMEGAARAVSNIIRYHAFLDEGEGVS